MKFLQLGYTPWVVLAVSLGASCSKAPTQPAARLPHRSKT